MARTWTSSGRTWASWSRDLGVLGEDVDVQGEDVGVLEQDEDVLGEDVDVLGKDVGVLSEDVDAWEQSRGCPWGGRGRPWGRRSSLCEFQDSNQINVARSVKGYGASSSGFANGPGRTANLDQPGFTPTSRRASKTPSTLTVTPRLNHSHSTMDSSFMRSVKSSRQKKRGFKNGIADGSHSILSGASVML